MDPYEAGYHQAIEGAAEMTMTVDYWRQAAPEIPLDHYQTDFIKRFREGWNQGRQDRGSNSGNSGQQSSSNRSERNATIEAEQEPATVYEHGQQAATCTTSDETDTARAKTYSATTQTENRSDDVMDPFAVGYQRGYENNHGIPQDSALLVSGMSQGDRRSFHDRYNEGWRQGATARDNESGGADGSFRMTGIISHVASVILAALALKGILGDGKV
jgi:hypothetical protein